jgi:hypothetical protein
VSILTALSKVLETVVKEDLEAHLQRTDALPNTQYGFWKGRSCTTALAAANARWVAGKSKVVEVLAFDLSAAFDTVAKDQLVPKMMKVGITGTPLKWFSSYMTGGLQSVDWNGSRSELVEVLYGVRQGSILGPFSSSSMLQTSPRRST